MTDLQSGRNRIVLVAGDRWAQAQRMQMRHGARRAAVHTDPGGDDRPDPWDGIPTVRSSPVVIRAIRACDQLDADRPLQVA